MICVRRTCGHSEALCRRLHIFLNLWIVIVCFVCVSQQLACNQPWNRETVFLDNRASQVIIKERRNQHWSDVKQTRGRASLLNKRTDTEERQAKKEKKCFVHSSLNMHWGSPPAWRNVLPALLEIDTVEILPGLLQLTACINTLGKTYCVCHQFCSASCD